MSSSYADECREYWHSFGATVRQVGPSVSARHQHAISTRCLGVEIDESKLSNKMPGYVQTVPPSKPVPSRARSLLVTQNLPPRMCGGGVIDLSMACPSPVR